MKIARLPTGELLEFPPDFPDDEMDRTVRGKLGVPEPPDQSQMLMQLIEAVMQQMAQQQMAQQQMAQMIAQIAQATSGSADAIQQGFERMERAYLAPRSIVTDKSGKPLGMKIG
jgi:hypothetical protein